MTLDRIRPVVWTAKVVVPRDEPTWTLAGTTPVRPIFSIEFDVTVTLYFGPRASANVCRASSMPTSCFVCTDTVLSVWWAHYAPGNGTWIYEARTGKEEIARPKRGGLSRGYRAQLA